MVLLTQCAPQCAPEAPPAPPDSAYGEVIGYSVQGRPIEAQRYGDGGNVIVIVGQTHGNEDSPHELVEAAKAHAWSDTTVWVIDTANPDGAAVHSRYNANGVDLNRDGQAMSQPESRTVRDFVARVGAVLTVYPHSPSGFTGWYGGTLAQGLAQRYAASVGLAYHGWVANHPFLWVGVPGQAILVEFPAESSYDCSTCSLTDRRQTTPDQVRLMADVLVDTLDRDL